MKDVETNVGKLRAIHDLGVKIAIDDFGTVSSLSYLARLPVQVLQDRRHVHRQDVAGRRHHDTGPTMISLAHSLG
jgi:EAL domain-containing protein (putative c-di-GMP-specific phosphodiesterase class I)